jgi:UDP-glucose 4-epimerase
VSDSSFWSGFDPARYTAILFFAGITGTEAGFADAIRYTRVNDLGLLNLLVKLAPLGRMAPKVIFPSSRLVYRGSDAPLSEEAPKEAKTVYAANKIACELYLEAYRNRFGIPYAVVRICVPYGNIISSDYSYGTIGFFMRQIAQGKPIALFGGGKQGRTFTHVEDICTAVKLLMDCSENGIFNVGGENMSLYEAALKVVGGDATKVQSAEWPPAALLVESGGTMFDSTKLEKLGWKARHRL